jgi:hypothetical protein
MDIITEIMELFGAAYLGDFSKYMFMSGAYSSVFYVMLLLPILVAFCYYIVLDHILLAQTRKWLIIGAVTSAVAALAGVFIAHQQVHRGETTGSYLADDVVAVLRDIYCSFGHIGTNLRSSQEKCKFICKFASQTNRS